MKNNNPLLAAASYRVVLKPLSFLRRSEQVDDENVRRLAATISAEDIWTSPLPVERDTGIIMDGNHRICAASLLGLAFAPCVLLDYRDPRVSVRHWQSDDPFDIVHIYRAILEEHRILPHKTTRHSFAPALPQTRINLRLLRTGDGIR
ncbi:transcriptional regulator [Herbaspirillum sp. RTI4]|uniref:transcriptional regulator n=1 Tax=Herbaspirillum sp. RTI4 TaxID=3048640 RepID=UPI002AB4A752|nr:transcriptional regulator [Herbaspirillum sp. RTI4]MDY7579985.1 transcriptional regulator [Herbaspirillum sp. RTI4]MEA9982800.1 transcriptional regulator [Herbaspirillum sp. RTI4]